MAGQFTVTAVIFPLQQYGTKIQTLYFLIQQVIQIRQAVTRVWYCQPSDTRKYLPFLTLGLIQRTSLTLNVVHSRNIADYLFKIEQLTNKQKRARKYSYLGEINSTLTQFQEYVALFINFQ